MICAGFSHATKCKKTGQVRDRHSVRARSELGAVYPAPENGGWIALLRWVRVELKCRPNDGRENLQTGRHLVCGFPLCFAHAYILVSNFPGIYSCVCVSCVSSENHLWDEGTTRAPPSARSSILKSVCRQMKDQMSFRWAQRSEREIHVLRNGRVAHLQDKSLVTVWPTWSDFDVYAHSVSCTCFPICGFEQKIFR